MTVRPIEQWQEILAAKSSWHERAERILGDLVHYQSHGRKGALRPPYYDLDIAQLAAALQAIARRDPA